MSRRSSLPPTDESVRPRGILIDYIKIARPDHWIKHILIVPGIVLAWILIGVENLADTSLRIGLGLVAACLIASANYVINEWLDLDYDKHHPLKSQRPAVMKSMSAALIYAEYTALVSTALLIGFFVGQIFLTVLIAFVLSGLLYNVSPLRTKERAYVDVLTESINNPIRLALGWTMISASVPIPVSIVIAYWMGGAFLMTVKRLAEFRHAVETGTSARLVLYRRTFRVYSEQSLVSLSVFYAAMSAFFLGVFLIKYRIEYLLLFPIISVMFAQYTHMSMKSYSLVQTPEFLYKDIRLVFLGITLFSAFMILSFVDLQFMRIFLFDIEEWRISMVF